MLGGSAAVGWSWPVMDRIISILGWLLCWLEVGWVVRDGLSWDGLSLLFMFSLSLSPDETVVLIVKASYKKRAEVHRPLKV